MKKELIKTTFYTISGAKYQISHRHNKIIRLPINGNVSKNNESIDGQWKDFIRHTDIIVGKSVTIYCSDKKISGLNGNTFVTYIVTSPVVLVVKDYGDLN